MNKSDIILYSTPEGSIKVEVILQDENVWLSQKAMAELFGADRTVITKHLGNIFKEKELVRDSVCAKIAHTAVDGKKYDTLFYNLDAIISVGYRVNSNQAERKIPMKMKDWIEKLDSFLQFNDYSVLKNSGTISATIAKKLADQQYDKFRVEQDRQYESDFDREISKIKKNN